LELQQFVFTHVGLFVDHIDVYDVRYGHRLELNFTLEELFSLYEPINAYVNLDETDLNQMLTIQMFIKNNHLILLEFEIEGLTILLESSFDELSWFGITVHDGFVMDCTLDFSLFYHLHDVNPVLPTPSTLSAYRMVEAFSTPSLDDFTLFGS
ncbi:MAG: hypothetical protein IH571_06605, partial [Acholeplasmataceae bacterium]|nr:hypothetical protein [Acholeplasmataceae bacterium]